MDGCIFCKIINREMPADVVYESDNLLAFRDIKPVAPAHIIIVPKKHIKDFTEFSEMDVDYIAEFMQEIAEVADTMELVDSGYRLITNCGEDGGQTIFHFHFHLIGGVCLGENLLGV